MHNLIVEELEESNYHKYEEACGLTRAALDFPNYYVMCRDTAGNYVAHLHYMELDEVAIRIRGFNSKKLGADALALIVKYLEGIGYKRIGFRFAKPDKYDRARAEQHESDVGMFKSAGFNVLEVPHCEKIKRKTDTSSTHLVWNTNYSGPTSEADILAA